MATKEQQREWSRAWAKAHPDKISAAKKKYRAKNKEKIAEQARLKRINEREKLAAAKRKWEKENPAIVSMQRARRRIRLMNAEKNRSLRFHYQITIENFKHAESLQGGLCLICGKVSETKKSKRLVVDHDHETGSLRGLLCHRCNCGLGYFKDDIALVARALDYLSFFAEHLEDEWTKKVALAVRKFRR